MRKRFLPGFLFFIAFSFSAWPQPVSVPAATLEEIRREALLIREESNALWTLLTALGNESAGLKKRLLEAEAMLTEAEASLGEASLSLEKSEAELMPLREGLRKLSEELAASARQAAGLSARLTRLEREKTFWKALAISAGLAFGAIEIGRAIGR